MSGGYARWRARAASRASTRPTGPSAAAHVASAGAARPNGVWGMALFLCSEATMFGTLLATYFYLDFDAHRWPPAGIKAPSVALPLVATGVLVLHQHADVAGLPQREARRAATACLGLISLALVIQMLLPGRADPALPPRPEPVPPPGHRLRVDLLHDARRPSRPCRCWGSCSTRAVLGFVALRGLTNYWTVAVRALAIFWYVVNALAILVVLTQLSPSL